MRKTAVARIGHLADVPYPRYQYNEVASRGCNEDSHAYARECF